MNHSVLGGRLWRCSLLWAVLAVCPAIVARGGGVMGVLPSIAAPPSHRTENERQALERAEQNVQVVVDVHPDSVELQIVRAQLLLLQEAFSEARDGFAEALSLGGRNAEALLGIATASVSLNEPDDALDALDQLARLRSMDAAMAALRVEALLQNEEPVAAGKFMASTLGANAGPGRIEFLAALVPLQLRARDFEGAETGAGEWIELKPTADAYAYRAEARRQRNKLADARADIDAGFKLEGGTRSFPMLFVASRVMRDAGDAAAAIVNLVDLLALFPGNIQVEEAIDQAVVARTAEIQADKSGKQLQLIPPIDFDGHEAQIADWKFRQTIGNERVHDQLEKLTKALWKGELVPERIYTEGRNTYPAPEFYAALGRSLAVYSMDSKGSTFYPPEVSATWTAQDFRVAAALAAVKFARHCVAGYSPESDANGYLEWAGFQDRVRTQKLSKADEWLIRAQQLEEVKDDAGALAAYQEAENASKAYRTGPVMVLRSAIVSDRERLRTALGPLMAQVDHALEQKDAKQAMQIAGRILVLANHMPEGWVAKAKALRFMGEKEKGAEALSTAIKRDAFCAEARLLNAGDLEQTGKLDAALFACNFGARGQIVPSAGDSRFVGQAIEMRTRLEKGREAGALRKLYANQADAAYKERDWETAMVCASRLKGMGTPVVGVFVVAGVSAEGLGRHAEALGELRRAVTMDPKMRVYHNIGDAAAAMGDFNAAIEAYDKAIELEPGVAAFYYGRGMAERGRDSKSNALSNFKMAVEKGDTTPHTALLLADMQADDDPQQAVNLYKQIIEKHKDDEPFFGAPTAADIARARVFILEEARVR
jgi:tetratricopeptide (TPR) repeat protein